MVPELSFGFWTSLIAKRYEKLYWVPYLHKCFPGAVERKLDASGNLKVIAVDLRKLRNRIAHHEPIIDFDLAKEYAQIIETISWICPTTSAWVSSTHCFQQRWT